MSLPRVVASLLAGLLGAVGTALLLMREETHFVQHALPVAMVVAPLAMALTWRSLGD